MRLVTYLLISRIQPLVEILSVQIIYFRSLLLRDSCEVGVASRWLLAGGIYNSSETESAILDPPNSMSAVPLIITANGLAERFVQSVKQSVRATSKSGRMPNHRLCSFLLTYPTSPHSTTGVSPSSLLMK